MGVTNKHQQVGDVQVQSSYSSLYLNLLVRPNVLKTLNDFFTCWGFDLQAEQAAKVEKMRQSVLEGLNFSRQNHPLPFPPPPALPFYPASVYPRHFGPVPPSQGRGRGFAGELCVGTPSPGARMCDP